MILFDCWIQFSDFFFKKTKLIVKFEISHNLKSKIALTIQENIAGNVPLFLGHTNHQCTSTVIWGSCGALRAVFWIIFKDRRLYYNNLTRK